MFLSIITPTCFGISSYPSSGGIVKQVGIKYYIRNVFILVIIQLDAQNLFNNKFISSLYMFRAPFAHRQEVKILLYSIWYH